MKRTYDLQVCTLFLAGKVMKKAGEITNYRREKREKYV